jgi:hypothetical protein
MKPFKITLNLNPEASPHLYIRRINGLIAEDEYLHPMLKGLLLTLKKARMPFVRLSLEKEMVISPDLHCHFERAIKPEARPWGKIMWEEDEIKEFEENPKKYIKAVLELQKKIGYDFFDKKDVDTEEIEELLELTKLKKKAKKWWAKQCK